LKHNDELYLYLIYIEYILIKQLLYHLLQILNTVLLLAITHLENPLIHTYGKFTNSLFTEIISFTLLTFQILIVSSQEADAIY